MMSEAAEYGNHASVSTRSPLVILGAGGTSIDFCDAAVAGGHEVLGLLDDGVQGPVCGFPVLGPLDAWRDLPEHARFFCGIGSTSSHRSRLALIERLGIPENRYGTIIHPTAVVSPSAVIGPGCGILAMSAVGCQAVLASHVEILQLCLVAHDCRLDTGAIVAGGANLAGGVHVGCCAYVGSSATVRNGLRLGAGSLLGMNATLTEDLPANAVYAGTPARPIPAALEL
jgi:sugar O-acyltransferase (sialic acid O-acetyltransferase NeuD family)